MIPLSPLHMAQYLLPFIWGLQWQKKNNVHVNLFIHMYIGSSKHDIQDCLNTLCVCPFRAFIICKTSNNLSLKVLKLGGGRGGGYQKSLEHNIYFQTIARHKLVHNNCSPSQTVYRGVTKILCTFFSSILCHKNPTDPQELTGSRYMSFDSSIGIPNNDIINKTSWQEEGNYLR